MSADPRRLRLATRAIGNLVQTLDDVEREDIKTFGELSPSDQKDAEFIARNLIDLVDALRMPATTKSRRRSQ